MQVHIIADAPRKFTHLRSTLEPAYSVTCANLIGGDLAHHECGVAIVAADLRNIDNIAALKDISLKFKNARRRVFIIETKERRDAVQAYVLGATHVLTSPLTPRALLTAIADVTPPDPRPKKTRWRCQRGGSQRSRGARLDVYGRIAR